MTPEAVLAALWEESHKDSPSAPRVQALGKLADYYGLSHGSGKATDSSLPSIKLVVETKGEDEGDTEGVEEHTPTAAQAATAADNADLAATKARVETMNRELRPLGPPPDPDPPLLVGKMRGSRRR